MEEIKNNKEDWYWYLDMLTRKDRMEESENALRAEFSNSIAIPPHPSSVIDVYYEGKHAHILKITKDTIGRIDCIRYYVSLDCKEYSNIKNLFSITFESPEYHNMYIYCECNKNKFTQLEITNPYDLKTFAKNSGGIINPIIQDDYVKITEETLNVIIYDLYIEIKRKILIRKTKKNMEMYMSSKDNDNLHLENLNEILKELKEVERFISSEKILYKEHINLEGKKFDW